MRVCMCVCVCAFLNVCVCVSSPGGACDAVGGSGPSVHEGSGDPHPAGMPAARSCRHAGASGVGRYVHGAGGGVMGRQGFAWWSGGVRE